MRRDGYEIRRTIEADPDLVFGLLADAPSWSSWARPLIMTSRWSKDGVAGGVGAVRITGMWPFLIREEITEQERPSRLSYRYIGRLIPVKDYQATIALEPVADGTTGLTWSASFTTAVPGPGVRWGIEATVRLLIALLVREATRSERSSTGT
ncbi:Polyketide cyclase / dehydrase and lipid transport [Actinomadura rubteroloni]|uniref:Polyketide cyclase / dehydrase and lipid transport n=1 Tax=Actinomadura rubteroloni TaxID=1926885 RepID=A0A2P4UQK0_9ACTN|nr:SRPBCC family protein [Actinomadura rubteroloni]POM27309.1 Polyketide cyclase / dehydrase and lipid transport [Actinomadura rubteroloni]